MFEYQGEIIEMLFSCRCQLLFGNDLLGNVLIFHVKNKGNLAKVCVDSGWNTGFLILEKEMVLVTGSQDSKIRFWDFSGSLKKSFECFAGVTCIEKSQNEEFLAIGSHNCKILVVQNFTQKFHLDDHFSTIISMKFINNDKNLVTSSSLNLINLWKLNTKEKIASVSLKYSSKWLVVNDDWVFGVSFKGEITKMNTNDLNTLKIDSIKIPVVSVQMSADSKFLIGFNCKAVFLYDIFNSKPSIFQGHEKEITSIKVKKSANLLVSISDDLTIKLWNIKEKNLRTTLTFHQSPVESFILTKEKLISLSNDLLCIWSFTNDKLDHSISYKTRSFLPRVDRILLSKSKSILVISEIKLKGEVTLIKLDSLNTLSFEVGEFDSFKSLSIPLQDRYLLISEPLFIHVFRIA
jgi:WD40 repeat protein